MSRAVWLKGLLVLGLLLAQVGLAEAGRTPIIRNSGQRSTGARTDVTVPYTTNGPTAFGVYNGVAPRIYASPVVEDFRNPGAKPVFNLIFYGAVQSFGDRSEGAKPGWTNHLRR